MSTIAIPLQSHSKSHEREMLIAEVAAPSLHQTAQLPSPDSFLCLLQECRETRNLGHAKSVHLHICVNGLEAHKSIGNYLVPMFVECGSMLDALHAFNKLAHQNEYSWTSLIQGHVECGDLLHAFDMFQTMQAQYVLPSTHTFVALLKACSQLKSMDKGLVMYNEILLHGFERHPFVCNALVDMYANCGALAEAADVFDKLADRDTVSWTALIAGYADQMLGEEALHCLELMHLEGISPNAYTFVCSLKACDSIEGIGKARAIHKDIIKHGFEQNIFIGNTLVDTYAKSSSLSEAQKAFDKLPFRDVVSWTAMIAAYSEHGLDEEALNYFEWMQVEGVHPNAVTYVCSLKACGNIRAIERGQELHAMVVKLEFERDIPVGNALVDMYAKCGLLAEAQELFAKLRARDSDSWNTLIAEYAEQGFGEDALTCLELMQLNGMTPDDTTFASSLKACGSIEAIEKGQEIHAEIAKEGFEIHPFVGSTLVDMYAKCHALVEARDVFDNLPFRDAVIWTALITGYLEHRMGEEALDCLEHMQMDGCSPDVVTLVCSLKACSIVGATDRVWEIHSGMTKMGLERENVVGGTLVNAYATCGSLVDAHEVFEKLPFKETVSCNALIAGYTKHGFGEQALDCLEDMQLNGVLTDAVTLVCSLKACGSLVAIHKGREIHDEAVKRGLERDSFIDNSLVDMYAKCGSLADVISWTSLMAGYWEHGFGEEALNCLTEMQLEGVSPDAVTFVCILKACGSTGSLEEGQQVHAEIIKEGFENVVVVSSNLADMYALCGSHAEAEDVSEMLK